MMIKIAMPTLVLLALATHAAAAGIAFPGSRFVVSPDSQWVVNCRGTEKQGYLLEAARAEDTAWKQFFLVGRWCEVLWQGRGSHVAITDWGSGRSSQVVLIDLVHPEARMPLLDLVPGLGDSLQPDERSGSLNWEALRWSADSLVVRVFGHTHRAPTREFAYEFRIAPSRRTWVLLSKDNEVGSRAETKIRATMRLGGRPAF